jgi:hypothetical protein
MVAVVLTVFALATCLGFAIYLVLPKLVTDRLPVTQIQRLGFADFTGRVSRIGLRQTAAGPFVLGPADQPALAIRSVELDYTVGELSQKKIRCLRISDVTVNVSLGPDGIALPGMHPGLPADQGPAGPSPADASSPLAGMVVEKIAIRSGMLNLSWGNAIYKIPFEADLEPDGADMMHLGARVHLFPRDQQLTVTAQMNLENHRARLSLDGPVLALDRFADLIHRLPGVEATGQVALQAGASLSLNPLALSDARVDLTWLSGRLNYASLVIGPMTGATPAFLSAVSADLNTWQVRGGGVQLQQPVPVVLDLLAATANLNGDLRTADGRVDLSVGSFSIERPMPVAWQGSLALPLRFDMTHHAAGDWTAGMGTTEKVGNTRPDTLDLTAAGVRILAAPPRFSLTARGDGQGGTADWQLDLNTIQATVAGAIVKLPSSSAKGQLQFAVTPHGLSKAGETRIQVTSPTFAGHGLAGKLGALALSARFEQQVGRPPVVDARLLLSNGQLGHTGSGLHLSGGRLDLPFRSGTPAMAGHGTFSVDRLVHNQRSLGKIQGRVTPKKDAYDLSATHVSDIFPGMTASFSGTVYTHASRFGDADFNVQLPPYQLAAENDLAQWVPALQAMTFSGLVSARGKGSLSRKGVTGSLEVAMAGGAITLTDRQISVEGIDTTLHFPELPRIRSGPAQQIRFARAAMGGIVVDGGSLDVQVESANTLFIENGRLNWCGGKVDAQALRMTAGKKDYRVGLYCQRLNLSRILEQLGSVNARGSGTVNGGIPVVISNGNIRFDDGFLFSTPGEGGRIQLTGTDILTRGIPAGTPQFAQVELAQAALKDFAYTWAKLGLVSEGEDFIMRLQFDGKPVNPLPFIYKKEIGSFVRVEAGAQGSVFQGIGLDVNLRLPLNRLLQYKDIVNMIE